MRVVVTGADGFIGSNLRVRLRERRDIDVIAVTRATRRRRAGRSAARRRLRVPPRGRQSAAERRRVRRPATSASPSTLCAALALRPGAHAPVVVCLVDAGRARQPLRAQQAGRRGGAACVTRARPARRLCMFRLPERVRKMVPAELQLRGRDVLPQHRARPADRDQRSGSAAASWCISTTWSTRSSRLLDGAAPATDSLRGRAGVRDHGRRTRRADLQAFRDEPRHAAHRRASAPASSARCMRPTSATCPPESFAYEVPALCRSARRYSSRC